MIILISCYVKNIVLRIILCQLWWRPVCAKLMTSLLYFTVLDSSCYRLNISLLYQHRLQWVTQCHDTVFSKGCSRWEFRVLTRYMKPAGSTSLVWTTLICLVSRCCLHTSLPLSSVYIICESEIQAIVSKKTTPNTADRDCALLHILVPHNYIHIFREASCTVHTILHNVIPWLFSHPWFYLQTAHPVWMYWY